MMTCVCVRLIENTYTTIQLSRISKKKCNAFTFKKVVSQIMMSQPSLWPKGTPSSGRENGNINSRTSDDHNKPVKGISPRTFNNCDL